MNLTLIILICTCIVSFISFSNRELTLKLMFYPYEIRREKSWYRFLTYAFIHGDFMHLFINMWVLYIFGEVVEQTLRIVYSTNGKLYFMLLYFGGIIFSTLYSYRKNFNNPNYSAVGASGSISAITFAYILMYPLSGLYIFPLPIQIPAIIFGILYIAYSWFMGRRAKDNIGHDAHLSGAIFGILFMLVLDYRFAEMFWKSFATFFN